MVIVSVRFAVVVVCRPLILFNIRNADSLAVKELCFLRTIVQGHVSSVISVVVFSRCKKTNPYKTRSSQVVQRLVVRRVFCFIYTLIF